MKTKSKANLVLMILGIFLALSHIFANNLNFYAGEQNKSALYYNNTISEKDNLKPAKVWGMIHIDNNWSAAKDAGICTGNGTYYNPYIIEDLVINGGGAGSCIKVENSNVYFKIESCTLFNSLLVNSNAGIQLLNVSNSNIINNNCSSNFEGIRLEYSNNNTFSGNTANNNPYAGIYLLYSDNNEISGNSANNNSNNGVFLDNSNNNLIFENIINNNNYGIRLRFSDYNTIMRNTGINNNYFSYLHYSNNDFISNNTANYNFQGIYVSRSRYNNITGNTANYNLEGIDLFFSDYNSITGNTANFNEIGIYSLFSDYNIFSGNVANYNLHGLYLLASNYNNITRNTPNYNLYGIDVQSSNDNAISENIAYNNSVSGIHLYNCFTSVVWGNIASYNRYHGIYLLYCLYNLISGNFANNNSHVGIYLFGVYSVGNPVYGSDHNNITGNTANFNEIGILLQSSNNNTILENILIGNSVCISEDDCIGNEFNNNSCPYYEGDVIIPADGPPFPLGQILVASGILTVLLFIIFKKMNKS